MRGKSRTLLWILLGAVAAGLLAVGIILFCANQAALPSQKSGGEDCAYLLRETDGKIGLYLPDEDTPRQVLDIFTYTLPDYDQQLLKEGIPVADEEDLQKYLEEFDS
jgi:hypothetical protein